MNKQYTNGRSIIVDYELGYFTKGRALQLVHLHGFDIARDLEESKNLPKSQDNCKTEDKNDR